MNVSIKNNLSQGCDYRFLELYHDPAAWPPDGRLRCLLISFNTPGYYSLAVRILALTSHLSETVNRQWDIRYTELDVDQQSEKLFEAVAAWKPDIIALSVNIWNLRRCMDFIPAVKRLLPSSRVLLGGQEVTNSVTDFMTENQSIDYIVDGEGEIPFLQFLASWDPKSRSPKDPGSVSGLIFRENGSVKKSGPAELVQNLDDLPSPILAGLVPIAEKNKLGVMLEGARGCPYQCSFCFEGSRKHKVRMASIERLAAEARYMVEKGASYFHLLDPILSNSRPDRLKGIADLFKELNKTKKMQISLETYAQHLNDQIAPYLADFTIIDVGLQSINQETQKEIRRSFSMDRFRDGLHSLRKVNPNFNLYLICGLPHETLRSFLEGVAFVQNEKPVRMFINELCLLNGTELRRRATDYGYEFSPEPPYWVHASKWMSRWELKLAHVLSKIVVKRHNLSLRALFPLAPWVKNAPPETAKEVKIRLTGDNVSATQLREAPGANVEVIIGETSAGSTALHRLMGQLQLMGASRIKITAHPKAFSDNAAVERLIALGALHFRTFSIPNGVQHDSLAPVKNIARAFSMKGYAAIIPFSEVIVLRGDDSLETYQLRIIEACRSGVDLVTIPQLEENISDEWLNAMTNTFRQVVQSSKWLRVPEPVAMLALEDVKENDAVLSLMNKLDLLSTEPDRAPWETKEA